MVAMSIPKLQLLDVCKTKPVLVSGSLCDVEVLRGVSFSVEKGEVLALIGPSGSGKSTILRLINRLEETTSGRILLDGADARTLEVRALRRRVGMVSQVPALLDGTVAENISYGPRLRNAATRDARPAAYLELVGLEKEFLERPAHALSVGQQQRVAIARALANEPEVLLLDEPTSALDQTASRNILDLLRRLNAELGLTVIIVTHVLDHAKAVATRVVLLAGGQKVEGGVATEFFEGPRTELGRRFLAGDLNGDPDGGVNGHD